MTSLHEIHVSYYFARASAWTFTIKPFSDLLKKYQVGENWADPFAGKYSPAKITNDLNPEMPTKYHLDAKEFINELEDDSLDGAVFDPPYSYRQISEHYKKAGLKATQLDTSYNFYHRIMEGLHPKIKIGGHVISFGWNSNGFPKKLGYEKIELIVVAHGLHHNDTIALVQQKTIHYLTN